MRSALVVVAPELPQRPAQVTLIEDDDAIQALLSDSADPPFCVSIQIGRPHRQLDRLGAADAEQFIPLSCELAVPVVQQMTGEFLVQNAEIAELLSNPDTIGVLGDVPEHDPARSDLDEEQHLVCAQRSAGNGEEVACPDEAPLVSEEVVPVQAPMLGRWEKPVSLQYECPS